MKYPFFTQSCMLPMWRVWTGPLNSSLGSVPANPFCSEAKGTLCQALKLSSCVHDCQPVVNAQGVAFEALILAIAATTACHVNGGWLGSRPAFLNASLLYQNTVVELLKGKESICPLGLV